MNKMKNVAIILNISTFEDRVLPPNYKSFSTHLLIITTIYVTYNLFSKSFPSILIHKEAIDIKFL